MQAHSGPTKIQQPVNKTADHKTVSESEHASSSREMRETRAHSAPDLHSTAGAKSDHAEPGVWSVDTKSNIPPVSSVTTADSVASVPPATAQSVTTASSATKARTKSYATTQDGSRLSYCEVATGIESVSSKNEDDAQVGYVI